MKYPTYFEVTFYNASDTENSLRKTSGIIYSTNFTDAAEQIEEIYEEDLLSIDFLKLYDDFALLDLPLEKGKIIKELLESY